MQDAVHETRDGDRLRYKLVRSGGPAVTVVFLNGSFFNYHQWDLLSSRLNRMAVDKGIGVDSLFMDYRGFGDVPPLSRPFSFDAVQTDVLGLLGEERIHGDVRLVGSSLGSLVGLSLLDRFPGRFSSLAAYGLVAPVLAVVRHVKGVFGHMRGQLAAWLSGKGEERLDKGSIAPFAGAMWDTFVARYSRTAAAVKARGFTDAYASYILKYTRGTPASTIRSFLDYFTSDAMETNLEGAHLSPVTFQKTDIFHGTDDLVTPFLEVKSFCDSAGVRTFRAFQGAGHTDVILDGGICDALASAVLAERKKTA
ncbi:MAG: alpha/beta fold hydrolase [Candidatus Lokiarchaeota archaeon]|nr:alpha/beta fold hydrolase [Candidatus Lokiarchaeota archaeon]